jgi:hypothetical protein
LLLKSPPFTVRTKPAPPAVALLGESELTDGVDGQEQATAGSKKITNAAKRGGLFIVAIGVIAPIGMPSGKLVDRRVPRTSIWEYFPRRSSFGRPRH